MYIIRIQVYHIFIVRIIFQLKQKYSVLQIEEGIKPPIAPSNISRTA